MELGKLERLRRLETIQQKLRSRGFRLTPQRLQVVQILISSEYHPSAEELYQQVRVSFPSTSLATIYKTLQVLKELGEVIELSFADGGSRYDGHKPYPHPHVICVGCGEILDMDPGPMKDVAKEMSAKTGYTIQSHRHDFFGLCQTCQQHRYN